MFNKTDLETYGLIAENPIRLNSTNAALGYLKHLVTKHDGYHILFHKLMAFDFNVFDGIEKTSENTSDIYQICTNDQIIITVFINIHFDECVWIPPLPFEFEYDTIFIREKEMTEKNEDEGTLINIEPKYVNNIRDDWTPDDYDEIDIESQEYVLSQSWGVNYKTANFPHELWEKYIKENTYCLSDMNEEQLELRNKLLAEYEK